MFLIEEHHELVLTLCSYFKKRKFKEKFSLVHVDEHADMFSPIISENHLNNGNFDEIESLVYDELRICDFLLYLMYIGIIDEVLWVSNEKDTIDFSFDIKDEKTIDAKRELSINFDNKNREYSYHKSNINSYPPTLQNEKYILTIDFDFFSCNDITGETIKIEITEEEFLRFKQNRYHDIRLSYGNRAHVEEKTGRYYLYIHEYMEVDDKTKSKKEIIRTIHSLGEYLANIKITPELIVLCKSNKSGYVTDEEASFINDNLCILEQYIEWE